MARKKLSLEEKEKRKAERRAEKKAERLAKKADLMSAVDTSVPTRKRKGQSDFKLIEVAATDKEGLNKIAQLREAGIEIRQTAYATGYFVYKVPHNLTGFIEHGSGPAIESGDAGPVRPTKTLADLVAIVNEKFENKEKVNKRQIKLLVRGSELKRNVKKSALSSLLKQFKIK